GCVGVPSCVYRFLFFFQAEDGIRDFHVTGVQTCALPISSTPAFLPWPAASAFVPARRSSCPSRGYPHPGRVPGSSPLRCRGSNRSEERRVGKECRCRCAPYQTEKKKKHKNTQSTDHKHVR